MWLSEKWRSLTLNAMLGVQMITIIGHNKKRKLSNCCWVLFPFAFKSIIISNCSLPTLALYFWWQLPTLKILNKVLSYMLKYCLISFHILKSVNRSNNFEAQYEIMTPNCQNACIHHSNICRKKIAEFYC